MQTINYFGISLIIGILSACSIPSEKATSFRSDISGPTPWSYEPSGRSSDQFTIALVSDLNGGERDGIFSVAMEQVRLLRPDFIVTIGDLIDGGTEDVTVLKKQFDDFDARAQKSEVPLFHVGGNHDLTNPVMRKYWEERYGRRYYHFVYKNVLFLIVDSEDFEETRMQEIYHARAEAIKILDGEHPDEYLKTEYYRMNERKTGEISDEQSAYFEKVIAANPEVRWTMVFMHKPVWMREEGRNFSRIEKALSTRPHTVINGHLHSYSYQVRNQHDYIMLGTTGGSQRPNDNNAFDHITLVSFIEDEPSIATLRMDGIFNKEGKIPGDTVGYCYQASLCDKEVKSH